MNYDTIMQCSSASCHFVSITLSVRLFSSVYYLYPKSFPTHTNLISCP